MGGLISTPAPPDVDWDAIGQQVSDALQSLPQAISDSLDKVKSEWEAAKKDGKNYDIVGGLSKQKKLLISLKPDATDDQVNKAAYLLVAKGEFCSKIADAVWSQLEPKIDEKKPADLPNLLCITPDSIWNKVKDKVADKVKDFVSKKVGDAVDQAAGKKDTDAGAVKSDDA